MTQRLSASVNVQLLQASPQRTSSHNSLLVLALLICHFTRGHLHCSAQQLEYLMEILDIASHPLGWLGVAPARLPNLWSPKLEMQTISITTDSFEDTGLYAIFRDLFCPL
jgi:hypothetical protein